ARLRGPCLGRGRNTCPRDLPRASGDGRTVTELLRSSPYGGGIQLVNDAVLVDRTGGIGDLVAGCQRLHRPPRSTIDHPGHPISPADLRWTIRLTSARAENRS